MATVITDRKAERFVDTATRADGKNALVVDMGGDIAVGAVEIKDATTDTRAVVRTNGANNSLFVLDSVANSLVPEIYDYISLGYNAGNDLTTVIFKRGGVSGVIVSTLTLGYDVNGNVTSVTKS